MGASRVNQENQSSSSVGKTGKTMMLDLSSLVEAKVNVNPVDSNRMAAIQHSYIQHVQWLRVCGRLSTLTIPNILAAYLKDYAKLHLAFCPRATKLASSSLFHVFLHWCACELPSVSDRSLTHNRGVSPDVVRSCMPRLLYFVGYWNNVIPDSSCVRGVPVSGHYDSITASCLASFLEVNGIPCWLESAVPRDESEVWVYQGGQAIEPSNMSWLSLIHAKNVRWLEACETLETLSISSIVDYYLQIYTRHSGDTTNEERMAYWSELSASLSDVNFYYEARDVSVDTVRRNLKHLWGAVEHWDSVIPHVALAKITVRGIGIPGYYSDIQAACLASFLEVSGIPYWFEEKCRFDEYVTANIENLSRCLYTDIQKQADISCVYQQNIRWLRHCSSGKSMTIEGIVNEYLKAYVAEHPLECPSEDQHRLHRLNCIQQLEHWINCTASKLPDLYYTHSRGTSPADVRESLPCLLNFIVYWKLRVPDDPQTIRGVAVPGYYDSVTASCLATFCEIFGIPYWVEEDRYVHIPDPIEYDDDDRISTDTGGESEPGSHSDDDDEFDTCNC